MGILDEISDWVHDLFAPDGAKTLSDVGVDPASGTPGEGLPASGEAFPNSSNSAVMDQVNASVAQASQAYEEGMEIAEDAPQASTAGAQAQGIIDGVMEASPEQLAEMESTVGGLAASEEISAEVTESERDLADREAAHEAIIAADREEINAESVAADAEEAAEDAEQAT